MVDLLNEVLDEEKETRKFLLFKKLLPFFIVAVISGIVIILSYSWYSERKNTYNKKVGDMIISLTENLKNNKPVVNDLDQLIQRSDEKQKQLLSLIRVNSEIKNNSLHVPKLLEQIIDDSQQLKKKNSTEHFSITENYAKIIWISLFLSEKSYMQDKESLAISYLDSFYHEDQPFYLTATLLKGLFYLKKKQFVLAKQSAEKILQNGSAHQILLEQAKAILSVVSMQQINTNQ